MSRNSERGVRAAGNQSTAVIFFSRTVQYCFAALSTHPLRGLKRRKRAFEFRTPSPWGGRRRWRSTTPLSLCLSFASQTCKMCDRSLSSFANPSRGLPRDGTLPETIAPGVVRTLLSTAAARGHLASTSLSSIHRSRVPILQKAALFGNPPPPGVFRGSGVYGDKRGYVSLYPVRFPLSGGLRERREINRHASFE